MTCYNQLPENDQKVVSQKGLPQKILCKEQRANRGPAKKKISAENVEILKTHRKRWYEINKKRLTSSLRSYCQQNKDHIRNYRRQYCKNNRERVNEYWRSYYAKNKERIRQKLRDQKQIKLGQNIVRFWAWEKESEKLETSIAPNTLWSTDSQDLKS